MLGFSKKDKSKNSFSLFIILVVLLASTIFLAFQGIDHHIEPKHIQSLEEKVDSLLSLMTLEEKIGQMTQVRHFNDIVDTDIKTKFIGSVIHTQGPTPGKTAKEWQNRMMGLQEQALSTRLGIPLIFAVDAVHGQNTFEGATIFPHNIGMAASRNEELVEKAASITAIEMQATGFNWTFSPCIAIPFNEKWGRVYEAFSESPELTQKMAEASIKGFQGILNADTTVLATAKHYVGDGATDHGVEGGNTSLDAQQINDILLPPYRTAVQNDVGAVMVSFNSMSEETMHAHKNLITDTLKNAMGFQGMVVTDWKGFSRFGKNNIINAGIDMVMAVDGDLDYFQNSLKDGVDDSSVSMERIDDAVRRILRQKYRLGLFENPFPDTCLVERIGCDDYRDIARQAVRESMVLLKNKDQVLPIDKKTQKIVVVGEHANNSGLQSGGWTVNWQGTHENYKGATTILHGIQEISEGTVIYDQKANGEYYDADLAIIVVGESPYAEMMGDINEANNFQLTLTKKHQEYINAYKNKVSKIIVLLVSGRAMVVTEQIEESDAFVALWLLGSEGKGVAEVLFGDYPFKGKLPHSWPKSVDDYKGIYGPNYWDDNYDPLFEYGYGLSY